MRRGVGTILVIAALVAFFAAVAMLGLWIGRVAGERSEPRPTIADAPGPAHTPAAAAPALAGILPYRPAAPLDAIGAFRLTAHERAGVSEA
ncbi:MAG: hypothetical protein FJX64_08990 [Alphaproteobacteria bacterium]|nr:hypothetical protein [Alphaproteobacteria bacterium]